VRVLLVTQRFPPALGGVETWAEHLATGLNELDHEVVVLSRDAGRPQGDEAARSPYSTWDEQRGALRVRWVHQNHGDERTFSESWNNAQLREPMSRALEEFEPDIVHIAHNDGWGVVPFRLAEEAGVPIVVTLHDYKWICARGQMLRPGGDRCKQVEEELCVRCIDRQLVGVPGRSLLRRVLGGQTKELLASRDGLRVVENRPDPGHRARNAWRRRQRGLMAALGSADRVTSPSDFVAGRLREAGLDRDILTLPNGAGTPSSEDLDSRRRRAGPLRIGVFGRPHPSKGLDFLVTAFSSIPPGAAELHLYGASASDLSASPPPSVQAHGAYDSAQSVDLMADVDVIAIPSLWDENHPMVAVEALHARKPLLVSDLGGLPELVRNNIDGWIVAAGQAEAWGEQIALLAADPHRIERARQALPSPRSAAHMAREFAGLYAELLPEKGRGSR